MTPFPRLDSAEEAAIAAKIGPENTINGHARALGHSHKLIARIVREHGLQVAPRKLTTPRGRDADEVKRLTGLGWSSAEIADRLAIEVHAVIQAKANADLRGTVKPPATLLAAAERLAAAGRLAEELIEQLACPPRVASRLVRAAQRKRKPPKALWTPAGENRDAEGRRVFVASAAMYRMHDASLLTRIAERAGMGLAQWDTWKREHAQQWDWLQGWLRGGKRPAQLTLKHPSKQRRMKRPPRDGEFFTTPEMLAFRREASPTAIEVAAGCQRGRWIRRFPALAGWMLRGEDPPAGLEVLTANQAMRLARAWHVRTIVREMERHRQAFEEAIRDRLPRQGLAHWLGWLFGGDPPAGWYVAPRQVYELKRALTVSGRARAAGIDPMTQRYRDGRGAVGDPLPAALKSAGLDRATWERFRDEAANIGGQELKGKLVAYVGGATGRTGTPPAGLVFAPGLFVPSGPMQEFREASRRLRSAERLVEIERKLSPDLWRRLLCAFVLKDTPGGERLLRDERTFGNPAPQRAAPAVNDSARAKPGNDDRDSHANSLAEKGLIWKQVMAATNEHGEGKRWAKLRSVEQTILAVQRYRTRRELPELPKRRAGRPKNTNTRGC